uniref:Predicted protein n=1 Tax=Hordeum vulgare subsp. vulgare TaxID=112509 RepID=F2DE78_HORVV|nr:predicted protein [Hordeum vulgare subsp. vulgare]
MPRRALPPRLLGARRLRVGHVARAMGLAAVARASLGPRRGEGGRVVLLLEPAAERPHAQVRRHPRRPRRRLLVVVQLRLRRRRAAAAASCAAVHPPDALPILLRAPVGRLLHCQRQWLPGGSSSDTAATGGSSAPAACRPRGAAAARCARLCAATSAWMRRSVMSACRLTSCPRTMACSFTIPRSAHSAFLACAWVSFHRSPSTTPQLPFHRAYEASRTRYDRKAD